MTAGSPMELGHSNHCGACKTRVYELLTALYGECQTNHSFNWPSQPEQYSATAIGLTLENIKTALANMRGYAEFIKSPIVPPCDYFVAAPGFIVEFDESQHFSRARGITLVQYPTHLNVGFSVSDWQYLCGQINAQDDQPFDRDERRAWYDTLRDLVPIVHGFLPTIRLYAGEQVWCSLEANKSNDLGSFSDILRERLGPAASSR